LNSSIKQYIFKRTSRGGGGQSIAKSLYRWSLRRLLIWLYPDLTELKALLDEQRAELKQEEKMERKQRKRIEKQKLNLQQDSDDDSDDSDDDNNDDEQKDDDQDFAI
jgi:ABC-type Zn2+ transport system substrate-binding protein/surface adhesin